jgi:rhodanese-related sulfurtransferase
MTIVAYCHVGERSWRVAQFLARRGFRVAKSLRGGIEAWTSQSNPSHAPAYPADLPR